MYSEAQLNTHTGIHSYTHTLIHSSTQTHSIHSYYNNTNAHAHTHTVSKDVPPDMKSAVIAVTNIFLMFGVLGGIGISIILSALMFI